METVTQQNSNEVDVIILLRAIWNAKIFIILFTLICGLWAVYLAMTATPMFRAQTVVMPVEPSGSGGSSLLGGQFGNLSSIAGIDLGGGADSNYLAILKSRSMLESFIERNNLVDVISGNGPKLSLWFAVRDFQERIISIIENDDNGTVIVAIEWKDPAVAAEWANNFIVLANETIRLKATTEAQANIDYLSTKIDATNVVELRRVLYNLVESESKTLMLSHVRKSFAFDVIDKAVAPEVRSRPKRKVLVLGWLVVGFAFSLFLVFVYHMYKRVVPAKVR